MKRNGNIFLIVQLFVCQIFSPKVLPLPETVLCTEQSFSHPTPFSLSPSSEEIAHTVWLVLASVFHCLTRCMTSLPSPLLQVVVSLPSRLLHVAVSLPSPLAMWVTGPLRNMTPAHPCLPPLPVHANDLRSDTATHSHPRPSFLRNGPGPRPCRSHGPLPP